MELNSAEGPSVSRNRPDPWAGCLDLRERLLRKELLIETLRRKSRRTKFTTMGGNEIAPAGMHSGCPANWTIKDVLQIDGWLELSKAYEKGFRILEKSECPTAIVMQNTKFTSVSGSNVYLGEGDEWLQCVVENSDEPPPLRLKR